MALLLLGRVAWLQIVYAVETGETRRYALSLREVTTASPRGMIAGRRAAPAVSVPVNAVWADRRLS